MRFESFVFYIFFLLVHFVLFLFIGHNGEAGFVWFGFVDFNRLSFGWGFFFFIMLNFSLKIGPSRR